MTKLDGDDADWTAWDHQLEADIAAGKLDEFAAEALAELDRGDTNDITERIRPRCAT